MALGMGELILIMIMFLVAVSAAVHFLAKRLTLIGGKTCPHCAEKIKGDAKICRYCHLDVTGV
jgi:hypothetical protein